MNRGKTVALMQMYVENDDEKYFAGEEDEIRKLSGYSMASGAHYSSNRKLSMDHVMIPDFELQDEARVLMSAGNNGIRPISGEASANTRALKQNMIDVFRNNLFTNIAEAEEEEEERIKKDMINDDDMG